MQKFVQDKLNKIEIAGKIRLEHQKWAWSLVLCIFKEWPLPNFHKSPCANMEHKWVEIETILLENANIEPLSLEVECPHILIVFFILVRTLDRYKGPRAHHAIGLTLQYILDLTRGNNKSAALTNVVQSLLAMGGALFPRIHTTVDIFSNLHSNRVALLGYDPSKQVGVVERIRAFLGESHVQ